MHPFPYTCCHITISRCSSFCPKCTVKPTKNDHIQAAYVSLIRIWEESWAALCHYHCLQGSVIAVSVFLQQGGSVHGDAIMKCLHYGAQRGRNRGSESMGARVGGTGGGAASHAAAGGASRVSHRAPTRWSAQRPARGPPGRSHAAGLSGQKASHPHHTLNPHCTSGVFLSWPKPELSCTKASDRPHRTAVMPIALILRKAKAAALQSPTAVQTAAPCKICSEPDNHAMWLTAEAKAPRGFSC